MGAFMEIKLEGMAEARAAVAGLNGQARGALEAGVYEEGLEVMARSKAEFVPVRDGILRASGHVEEPQWSGDTVSVTLGYGGPAAPYALSVHQNPRAGKTGGVSPQGKPYKRWARVGEWMYLQTPLFQAINGMGARIGARIQQRISRAA